MDVRLLAARQLSDYDRRRPGGVFAEPGVRLSIEQAYELQFEVARLRELRGERVAGYKIGCISRTMQDQLGLDRPVFGHVWESELCASGSVLSTANFDGLAIEGEFAVRLATDVPSVDWLRHHPAVFAAAFAVIELHNYVFRGNPADRAVELIANNAIHAGVVMPVEETPLWHAGALLGGVLRVLRGSELLGEAAGHQLEGGPLSGIVRLVEHLTQNGHQLRRGQLVLTGSPLPLWRVSSGDRIEVQCNEFGKAAMAFIEV